MKKELEELINIDNGKVNWLSALASIGEESQWVSDGAVTLDDIKWNESNKSLKPTQAEIDAEVIRLQAEYDSQEYARKRKAEYDALNQLEMQFDDKEDGTTTWEDAINAIKAKYPKG